MFSWQALFLYKLQATVACFNDALSRRTEFVVRAKNLLIGGLMWQVEQVNPNFDPLGTGER